ncbi:MAG: uracil permease [Candidatus Woesearchaeota archaeon]|nr:uracil permease [Candidatus Woesearchaeota archaeon]
MFGTAAKAADKEVKELNATTKLILGVQMLFVAFGATVLVPLLTGLEPAVALFTAGVGTLIFHLVTKNKVPIFLGSSFAFIAPIIEGTKLYGLPGALGGLIAAGAIYVVVSMIVRRKGIKLIEKYFPAIVIGPVIMCIGLVLAPTGIDMAKENWLLATISLAVAIGLVTFGKKMLRLIPILGGIIVGYIVALFMGLVDFTPVTQAAWLSLPNFTFPAFKWEAIIYFAPVAIAPLIEHIGDIYTISEVTGKNFVENPGIHRTLLGDGLATMAAGFFGGPPNTTYSEVTGAVALTKVYDPAIMRIAAVTAIILAFVGKLGAILKTIPSAVLGGIMILLFGMIAAVGIRTLLQSRPDMNKTRNLVIVSVILTIGIGGATISLGTFSLGGIGLASVVGVILNQILPNGERKRAI